jgi:peptide-methionine (S)-S-oxide reductase
MSSCPSTETTISSTLALGAGCYWGTEKYIKREFAKIFPNSIKQASVGFMSPHEKHPRNPSYRQVCSGTTGHVEVLNVELNDPSKHFEELIRFFFLFHDPTTENRQGNDVGSQYASAVFVQDEEQRRIVMKVMGELQDALDSGKLSPYRGKQIVTQIYYATVFYPAHEEHQEYLWKNPNGYCNHYMRMKEWPLN